MRQHAANPDGPAARDVVAGPGERLPDAVRTDMETRLGQDFTNVRIHRDGAADESARSLNAHAYTVGNHIAFRRSAFNPDSPQGRKTLAHELTHVVQQRNGPVNAVPTDEGLAVSDPTDRFEQAAERTAERAMSGPTHVDGIGAQPHVQRCGDEELTVQRAPADDQNPVADAITQSSPGLIAGLDKRTVAAATVDQRLTMIDILNDRGDFFQRASLPDLWDSFGRNIRAVAEANSARWHKSFEVAASSMRASHEVAGLQRVFLHDVEDVAAGYLAQNDAYCLMEMHRLGLGDDGKLLAGPPTVEQVAAFGQTRNDAVRLTADQEALRDLRSIVVGYSSIEHAPGGADGEPVQLGGPVTFDPDRPPAVGPQPVDQHMHTWSEVKKSYDQLTALIRARIMMNPSLFPLVHRDYEDTSKTGAVAAGPPTDALTTLGAGLREVRDNIAKTRPLLATIAPDLDQIHGQLLAGTATAAPDRNWKSSTFLATIADDIVEQHKPGPWWQTLGLAGAQMGAYVVAGIATGGTAVAIGLAAHGIATTALSATRAQALEAAANATTTEETALISHGKVDEARAEVIESAAFTLLDVAGAVGSVRSALRAVYSYEKVAAEAAAKASARAEQDIAAMTAKDAASEETRVQAEQAAKAARDAEAAAGKASPDERARALASKDRAAASAERARRAAEEVAAEAVPGPHARPRAMEGATLKVAGTRVMRCASPCVELIDSVDVRATSAKNAFIGSSLESSVQKMIEWRFEALRRRAGMLSERGRTELTGLSGSARVAAEERLLDEGAAIEREVRGLERMAGVQATMRTIDKAWGDLALKSVNDRISAVESRARVDGRINADLANNLRTWRQKAEKLAADAAKPRPKDKDYDLIKVWQEIDTNLEGIEREEVSRQVLRGAGGRSLGESDAAVRQNLGIAKREKSPDIARDMGGGKLLMAESKGDKIKSAMDQFQSGLNSPRGKTYTSFEMRIYLKLQTFDEMVRAGGSLKEYDTPATNIGGKWFITGDSKVRGMPVEILPAL